MRITGVAVAAIVLSLACGRPPATAPAPAAPPVAIGAPMISMEGIAPNTVRGLVIGLNGRAPEQAVVEMDATVHVFVDTAGRFTFEHVATGMHRFRALSIGYRIVRDSFSVVEGAGTALVVRLERAPVQLVEVCYGIVNPSVIVRMRASSGAVIRVTHGEAVERFVLDSLHDGPDAAGTRSFSVMQGPGRFDISVDAPGFRPWRKSVDVTPQTCDGPNTQVVDVTLEARR